MKFVPTPQDYLKHLEVQPWMNNGVKELDNPEAYEVVKQLNQKIHEHAN
jgi:hypothetical protein